MRGAISSGEKIVMLRTAAGLTQEELAAQCECDTKTLRSAEHSRRVDLETLRRIARRLGVDFREIVAPTTTQRREANIAAVKRLFHAFNARDPDAVAEAFQIDGVIFVMAHSRLPGSGEFRGRAEIREWAQVCFQAYLAEPVTEDICQVNAEDDLVFVRLKRSKLEYLPNGQQANVTLMSEFAIRDNRIAVLQIYPESGALEQMAFMLTGTNAG